MHRVYVIISVKNRWSYTKRCIDSLMKQNYKNLQIVITDDGSTDETKVMLEEKYPEIVRLEGNGELWWAGGMNFGIRYILDKRPSEDDFILFVNNDTYFDSDFIKNIVKSSISRGYIPIGSISMVGENGTLLSVQHKIVKGTVCPIIADLQPTRIITDNDTLCGRGTLVPIGVFNKIGVLSKLFPHYHSDYDFFFRAKRAGYSLGVCTNAVTHLQDDASGLADRIKGNKYISIEEYMKLFFSRKSYFNIHSRLLLVLLYTPFPDKILMILKMLLYPLYVFFTKVRRLV